MLKPIGIKVITENGERIVKVKKSATADQVGTTCYHLMRDPMVKMASPVYA